MSAVAGTATSIWASTEPGRAPSGDGWPGASRGPDALPHRVGRYGVIRKLGQGAAGVVYQARDPSSGSDVALKVLRCLTPDDVARFQAEARAAARLRHPDVVAVYEAGTDRGSYYLALELVEGEALRDRLRRDGRLDGREAARLAERLAWALDAAHARRVLHRDLKPANVLLTRDGAPKLTDFGLAKDLAWNDLELTKQGDVLGTPAYMPPEQAEGQIERLDGRSDVYALGATLYEMLTGRPPYAGSVLAVLAQVRGPAGPPPPSASRPGLDPALEAICLRCLEKDPDRRFQSAAALAQALADLLDAWESAPPDPEPRRPARPRRSAAPAVVAVGALLAALGGLVALMCGLPGAASEQPPASVGRAAAGVTEGAGAP